ncbi:MAG: NADH-quinone oxidoreductase subunit N [Desulfobacterales bacterium]
MMDWTLFAPEFFMLAAAGLFFALSLARPQPARDYAAAMVAAAAGVSLTVWAVGAEGILFAGTYRVDLFSQVFKVLISAGFFLVICLCGNLSGVADKRHSEFYLLLAVCTLALMLLTSCVHLLAIYLALELSSYSLYILVCLRTGREKGLESGLKYFIIGACASALMLFGFALLYGTGLSLHLADLARELPGRLNEPVVLIGFVLGLSGFLFKIAAFPFHFWAPDVYEAAPHQAGAYIATVSKAGGIAVLMRITAAAGAGGDQLVGFLMVVSVASMTLGNLAAIAQQDLKRLLAFSSVAHAGYLMIAILSFNAMGLFSGVFYVLSLLIMKLTCFMIVIQVAPGGNNIRINDLAGLHRQAPVLAAALMLALFSLAGIPPTVGFTAKLLVFTAAAENGYLWLVIVAMVNVVISLYYYLRVLKAAYFLEPEDSAPLVRIPASLNFLALVFIFLTVAAGIYPQPFIAAARAMTQALIG